MKKPVASQEFLFGFHGPNLGYVIELYEKYLEDPDSIDSEMKEYFEQGNIPSFETDSKVIKKETKSFQKNDTEKIIAAIRMADYIRGYGHLSANVYPLVKDPQKNPLTEPEEWGLTNADLKEFPASLICPSAPTTIKNGADAIQHLMRVYTSTIAFEYHQVHDLEEKNWIRERIESGRLIAAPNKKKQLSLFKRLTEVEEFEKYLHRTFVGQKRFSIEGLDSLVPLLDEVVSEAVKDGVETVSIGMAHRGRLNVLAHVLGKPYERIFAEFQHAPNKELVPSEGSTGINFGWTGDVKYHLGLDKQIKSESTAKVRISLSNNPSHLEFSGAIVEGFTRAAQEERNSPGIPKQNPSTALAILIHGDAAFPGQGIVAETLNLSRLSGYNTGGTVHIIANNTIGFTTESIDSRSTRYASDLAKGYEIPIIHVNADDPEACVMAALLATDYRAKFGKDFLIDLIGYRRFGHNEMDEPMTTNPLMYKIVHQHPTAKVVYAEKLIKAGIINENDSGEIEKTVLGKLSSAYDMVPKKGIHDISEVEVPETVEKGLPRIVTSVPLKKLIQINEDLLNWPIDFKVFAKLERILKRRKDAFGNEGKVDWALAETVAFASIISDGTPVRLSGQDSERGTFAHRNIVLHDKETGQQFSPLHTLPTAKASFAVHNSPLSEAAVVGFEYGYNVFSPETLVLWEAQYGDFANAAQVMFDQFIAAGRAKWGQKSGLVLLLPHGYEGQGPEHSSARFERFLTLAAENNWTVANLTSAAQYFHILRRQAAILQKEAVRPLVLMTPKSLLRNPLVSSSPEEFSEGMFQAIVSQPGLGSNPEKISRVVLCTGKIAMDLAEKVNPEVHDWLQILRVEEIYPFPLKFLREKFLQFPNLQEVVWAQEEPKNMGAWSFIEPRINQALTGNLQVTYVGRRRRSSPAEGEPDIHKIDQARIISEALTKR